MAKSNSLLLINKDTLVKPDRRYWGVTATNVAELRMMYSIGLWDLQTNSVIWTENLDPAQRGRAWFEFPTPPSQYEVSEPAATVITPTQDGGKFVESQGNIFKDIRIAGTVGLRPNPTSSNLLAKIPGATSVTQGNVISTPNALTTALRSKDDRGLDPKEATGFDDIMFLRNIFRYYFDLKQNNEWARRTVMIWWYAKENEVYIVEPLSFATSRDAANPLGYTYNIQLRTLFKYDSKIKRPRDTLNVLSSISQGLGFVQDAIKDVVRGLEQLGHLVEFLQQLPFRVVDSVLSSALSVMGALANIATIGERFGKSFDHKFLEQWENDCEELARLGSVLASGRSQGDKRVFASTPTQAVPGVVDLPVIEDEAVLDIQRNEAIRAARMLVRVANQIRAQDFLFKAPKQVTVQDYAAAYNKDGQSTTPTGGSPLTPSNNKLPSSTREEEIKKDETIRSFAKRTTGDVSNWKQIAILNNLKSPYISTVSGDGVKAPGDTLQVPQSGNEGDLSTDDPNIDDNSSLSPVLQSYGRDLLLVGSASGGQGLADVGVGPGGDLAVVESVSNAKQGMLIKFSIEEGELPLHPDFGSAFPIGTKVGLNRLQEFALNARATMMSDDRVANIFKFRVYTTGDKIYVNAKAKLKQTDASFPVEFAVRRT